jgi:hypothetical protein
LPAAVDHMGIFEPYVLFETSFILLPFWQHWFKTTFRQQRLDHQPGHFFGISGNIPG